MEGNTELSKSKAFRAPIAGIIVLGLVFFVSAGSLKYWQAWIYWTIFSSLTLFITVYFFKRSPQLLAGRTRVKDQETVKKIPAFLNLYFLAYLVPGFDFRFHWSTVPVWAVIAANLMVFLGYVFIIIVFKENSYASANIKVEEEQQIVSTGPYAIIRHPMYTGLLVMILFAPLALGSYWAIIPGLLYIPWTVIRIKNEEELLLRELPGYKDYCLKIHYRLIPSIW
ncbi:MAG: S-isoprenylcysteine methyltransferase [Firmicutes bacterium HGW-Firmicutes-15]|nr:MAG: S-isoprenylcysteine methyltransferase [Firmicutes bacterium HGW-Firmicutes-15]